MHPERIGPFLIDKKIGAGGMGAVYRGRHVDSGHIAAVKVLPASLAREPGFVARFNREIKAMKTVQSPHIVDFYENGETEDETYFYAMEYVDGETLTNLLRREKRLGWKRVVDLSVQLATALKAAHIAGVYHRDLKPSNLMIARDGTLKLTDFGVAHVFASTRLTRTGGIVGTAEYMSPEQAKGLPPGKTSDLYSLGAVMYAMLTGRPPFTGKTSMDVVHKLQFANFDLPSRWVDDLPIPLEEIVCKLLEKEPARRYQDALQVTRELNAVLARAEMQMGDSPTISGPTLGGATPPTVAVGALPDEERGPGKATMVRNYVRDAYEQQHRKGRVGKFFNNTFVMISLLGLIIAGGFHFVGRSNRVTAKQKYDRGMELMKTKGPKWSIAKTEYFEPLIEDEEFGEKAKTVIRRIERYETSETIRRQSVRLLVSKSEPERLLLRAKHLAQGGDAIAARRTLTGLIDLLDGNAEFESMKAVANDMLAKLDEAERNSDDRSKFLAECMQRASERQQDGEIREARKIWQSVADLYSGDENAREIVEECNKLLQNTIASTAESNDTEND